MVPVISVIGYQNSGKTKVIENLLQDLINKGYRVGTIKHISHHKYVDLPGKDSYRHAFAGANPVIASGSKQIAIFHSISKEMTLSKIIAEYAHNLDLILVEGYKKNITLPKILVFSNGKIPVMHQKEKIIAIVQPTCNTIQAKYRHVSTFKFSQIAKLTDLVEKLYLSKSLK